MCGITGLINTGNENILKEMTKLISYRGPDDEGVFWSEKFCSGLGHRRLSIIDLSSRGHQPMSNEKGNIHITYNGEIYNYLDIKSSLENLGYNFNSNSDTEVILKSYEEWGEECLLKFNGMFAFAIYNSDTNFLFAARDRIGVKPFYYYQKNGSFIFSSEIKAILKSNLVEASPDYFSLLTPTRFQISPYTGFQDIFKLPTGYSLRFFEGKLELKKYWDINPIEKEIGEDTAIKQLDDLLNDSVKRQMISDVPVGIFLSGGLDSSIIAALMRKNTQKDIHSFTIKFSEKDQKYEKMAKDELYARRVAEQFDFNYNEIEVSPDIENLLPKIIWHLDEPLADPAAINTYLISKAARDIDIVVLLNGMGGDEIFGGYRKHLACLKANVYNKYVPGIFRNVIKSTFDHIPVASSSQGFKYARWLKRFLTIASLPGVERFLSSDLSLTGEQFENMFAGELTYGDTHFFKSQIINFKSVDLSYLTKMCLNDTKVMLSEHNLNYSDKASMAASIESRPPLTDHLLVEFMFNLTPDYRIKKNTQKYLLKKVSEKYLPDEIVNRPKAPFGSPLRSWIRGPLAVMVDDYLSAESLEKRNLYNPKFVERLIKYDRNGKKDNAHIIWTLLTNEIWFRTFFDKNL
ncbi:MAG: asparagine synthase (glutamine-hydrolyzing) [Ignavibacteria bacterium]|nr:asparagine synthase (glutamine-hydrolyzing) [Bacteroidota bacterium]MBL7127380.1 asparagine synthase (glutamine-hydrolyzing) [Ignavibacteria bacterium]